MIPFIRYEDSKAAIGFLEEAFGFTSHLVVENDGIVVHAQVAFNGAMVMLSDAAAGDGSEPFITTVQQAGKPTGGVYVVYDGDIDSHAVQAERAGATIIREPTDQDYGGREYTCLDPEGNIWSFGSYDPWEE
jgi:uncharacterized glyoxalase superfamily protein PhnB